ncbi:hypothetical protein WEI85_10090 [Actinomycetes bacterium KLBMP 9797]
MRVTKRSLVGAVVAATVAVVALGGGAVQAAPDGGKSATRTLSAPLDNSLAPDFGARGTVAASPAASAALATIQGRIADYVAKNGTSYTFGSYLDATTGRIVLATDAPASLVTSLTTLSGVSTAAAAAAASTEVRRTTTSDAFHRRDDIAPYYGGAGIQSGGGLCSTGYSVQNGAGTRFITTAGHCYADGATVLTESGLNTVGTVSGRRLPTVTGHPRDMELIGGQSYAGRIYTGGVTSTSSLPVVGAGSAVVGFTDYCHSGRTTGENCGHTATSITGQVCTGTGCKSPVIVFTGGVSPAGGDSGSPFYAKTATSVWIRGHVIAGDGVTSYAERWQDVVAQYGVSIVLG